MFDPFDPTDGAVKGAEMQSQSNHFFTLRSNVSITINDPVNFSFIEISNHNAQSGQVHYETAMYVWNKIQESGIPRPINNVKIYGADGDVWGGRTQEGIEKFWRNIFAGAASVRFHRPAWGLGNNPIALNQIKVMREFTNAINIFNHKPSNHLLSGREENEAYCLAADKKEFALYFPANGNVKLNAPKGKYQARWFNIRSTQWNQPVTMDLPGVLKTPTDDQWAVFIHITE